MRRPELARKLLAVFLFLHFAVLALNALPGSRFVSALFPYYGWYPRFTGQNQIWSMYQYPDRRSSEFELIARFDDGREVRPWGEPREMSSRNFYFLEALFLQNESERFARQFLDVLWQRWPEHPRPRTLLIRRTTTVINNYAGVPLTGVYGERQQQEIVRRW